MIEHNRTYTVVYDVIKRYASKENPIDQNAIMKKLQAIPDNVCERKTVARALEKLRTLYGRDEDGNWANENIKLHYEKVDRSTSPIYRKYWLEISKDDGFTDEELMYLMVAVQFSKHIDNSIAENIVKKLTNLSNNKYSGVFEFHTKINEKNVPIKQDFLVLLGAINDAIRHHSMISFYVNEYGVDKKLHHVGNKPIEVKPFRIAASEGYFYLLYGERHSTAIKNIRMDKITDLKDLNEEYTFTRAQEKALFYPNEYIVEHRYMNFGEPVEVTLRIEKSVLGDLIDSFGTNSKIEPAHHTSNRLTVHVKSSERDIVDWAMRYGDSAVILEPEYLRDEVMDRTSLISSAYRDRDSDIEYLERIKSAKESKRLFLRSIDLNGQDSYMDLEGIRTAVFYHNGISNFSFLASYNELVELTIARNEISDPDVLSGLSKLRSLGLAGTGITNLNFLTGLENLRYLSLNEYSIDNVEVLYSLTGLRILLVNKAIARQLDRNRLKRRYGDEFELIIDDYRGMMPTRFVPGFRGGLPGKTSRLLFRDNDAMSTLSTYEITDASVKIMLSSLIYSGTSGIRRYHSRFCFIDEACDGNERLDLYEDISRFAGDEYVWYITYDGEAGTRITEDNIDKIYNISIFKHDHGLKLVGLARSNPVREGFDDQSYYDNREKGYCAGYAHVQHILNNNIGWAEVSGELERLFCRAATINDLINPAILMNYKLYKDITVGDDEYHYTRSSDTGKKAKKIAYGHIELG
jgi:Leucine-rich repeat (LRR) protein